MRGWVLVCVCLVACGDDSDPAGDAGREDARRSDVGTRDSGGDDDDAGGGTDRGGGGMDCRVLDSWPAEWAAAEMDALAEMNRNREAATGCASGPNEAAAPLEMSDELRIAARCHTMDMATNDFFSHTGSDDSNFSARARDAGYEGRPRNENIAAGNGTGVASVGQWMSSTDGHCEAIMNGASNEVGIGYMPFTPSMWRHYWTAVFGSR